MDKVDNGMHKFCFIASRSQWQSYIWVHIGHEITWMIIFFFYVLDWSGRPKCYVEDINDVSVHKGYCIGKELDWGLGSSFTL